MELCFPTIDEPASPEYVLEVLRDEQRQEFEENTIDPSELLSFDMTVLEWQETCDLVGWRELGRAMNVYWNMSCTDSEWREVLVPGRRQRLRGVCEIIARHGTRPRIRPATIAGSTCDAAGAFLSIRSMLTLVGANGKNIAPSTPLIPYLWRYPQVLACDIRRLAPGRLPIVKTHTPVQDAGIAMALLGMARALLGWWWGVPWATALGVFLLAVGTTIGTVPVGLLFRFRIEFGELKTFRDLAIAVAEGNRKWTTAGE